MILPMKKLAAFAVLIWLASPCRSRAAKTPYTPPASPRATFNFNPGWKFIREDVTNAEKIDFDDSKVGDA